MAPKREFWGATQKCFFQGKIMVQKHGAQNGHCAFIKALVYVALELQGWKEASFGFICQPEN